MDKIPITIPLTGEEEERAAADVIRSGWLTQGPRTAGFEKKIAGYVGAAEAVAASSCTTALVLSLLAAGVGEGDEVVTTAYSFIATANAIVACGARPVLADIDPATYNLDPKRAEEKITSKTKALMPVHQVGLPADLPAFKELAEAHSLALIEDAACAMGSRAHGRPIGAGQGPGNAACFSFHPRKLITTGEGGMITTDDPELADRCRRLSSHGTTVSEARKHAADEYLAPGFPILGYNYRLSDVLAAIGLAQMDRLEFILARRRELATMYDRAFKNNSRIITPVRAGLGRAELSILSDSSGRSRPGGKEPAGQRDPGQGSHGHSRRGRHSPAGLLRSGVGSAKAAHDRTGGRHQPGFAALSPDVRRRSGAGGGNRAQGRGITTGAAIPWS